MKYIIILLLSFTTAINLNAQQNKIGMRYGLGWHNILMEKQQRALFLVLGQLLELTTRQKELTKPIINLKSTIKNEVFKLK